MRPQKISREELLQRCANTFKRYGYAGTSMSTLAAACGLTKASFYHHYSSKELLLQDVLQWAHGHTCNTLSRIVDDEKLTTAEKIQRIDKKIKKVFFDDSIGCLMATTGTDVAYLKGDLLQPVQAFFDDWAALMARLFAALPGVSQEGADKAGRLIVGDYEGAILLARIYQDASYVDNVTRRAEALAENPQLLSIYAV